MDTPQAVDLDDEPLVRPMQINLQPLDADVGARGWKTRVADQGEHSLLGSRAGERRLASVVEGAAHASRATGGGIAGEDSPEIGCSGESQDGPLLHGSCELSRLRHAREVKERSGGRRERHAAEGGPVAVLQAGGPVYTDPRPAPCVPARHRDVDRVARRRSRVAAALRDDPASAIVDQTPQQRGRAMADHGTGPAGERGRRLTSKGQRQGMPDEVDADVHAVQATLAHAMLDPAAPEAGGQELRPGDHAVLGLCDGGDTQVSAGTAGWVRDLASPGGWARLARRCRLWVRDLARPGGWAGCARLRRSMAGHGLHRPLPVAAAGRDVADMAHLRCGTGAVAGPARAQRRCDAPVR